MSYDSISKTEELLEFKPVSRILKNWEPVELLGSGGFACVFRMRNCLTGEEAALKFAPEPRERDHCSIDFTGESRENIRLLIHETEEVKKFRGQQHIIQYKEEPEKLEISIKAKGTCVKRYAVLSLMPVHTPIFNNEKKFISEFKNYEARLRLGIHIAIALTELNRQHTRHRDIKPQNILMDSKKNFLLSDFGEARQGDSTMRFGQTGSKYYKAPEVVHPTQFGQNRDRADIYSFGIVLYQLFNNGVDSEKSYPFFDKNGNLSPSARQYAQRHKLSCSDSEIAYSARYDGLALEKPCEADSELSEIILKACAYNPNDRYKNAQELLDALHKYTAKFNGSHIYPRNDQIKTVRSGDLSTPPPPPPRCGCVAGVLLLAALSAFAIPKILPEVIQIIFPNPISVPTTSSTPTPSPTVLLPTQISSPTALLPTPAPSPTALSPTPTPSPSPSLSPSYTPTPISEYVQSGDYYIEAFMDGTCALRGYRGNEEYLSVPEVIDGKRVVEIGSYAFAQHNFEKTVNFIDFNDDGTIETDFAAYYDQWYRLCNRDTKSIFIPEGVVSIDANAFTGCLNLSHVSILGKSVAVDENAFNQCEKIETISKYSGDYFITIQTDGTCVLGGYIGSDSYVTIPQIIDGNRVIGIESYAFNKRDNESLTSVVIPDGVISIDFDAFYGCDKLVTVTIPESVVGIIDRDSYRYPYEPFSSCSSLQTIRGVHGSEAEIYAYDHGYHFEALATATQSTPIPKEYLDFKIRVLEDGSCEITDYAGSHEHLLIPQEIYGHRVVGITDMAFEYSDNLKSIVIPDSISSIDQSVFHFCSNLVDVQLPNSIKTIAAYTFQACESLESIVIPDGVISIREDAFMWSGLTNITIPSSVVSIDDDAFAGSNLTRIYGIFGSTAETIAHELGVEFVDLSAPAPTHTPSPSFTPIPTPTAIRASSTPEILSGQSPTGFGGTISVEVERQNNRISDIRILQAYESEDRGMPAINEMIDRMIDSNSTNVDYVSGATISSKAIVKAVKNALEK